MKTAHHNGKLFTISKLAEQTGVSVHCIRTYANQGLIQACDRTKAGYHLYQETTAERLRFIRKARGAGVPIRQLVSLFAASDSENRTETEKSLAILEHYLQDTREKLATFEQCLRQKFFINADRSAVLEQLEDP